MEEKIEKDKLCTLRMAEYAVCDHTAQLTEKDIRMTRLSFLDWLSAAVSGCKEKSAGLLMDMACEEHASGDCVLIGQNKCTSPLYAALINGTLSHAIDFDDIHDFLSLHLSSPVFPAALAAAQISGASGMELINGSINGMQIMVAVSAAIMPEHYNIGRFHATGTIGIFGAAAAAGAILKLTPEQMCNAFGISAGLMSGIQLNFGTMAKPMAAGMAAKNGLMAALLAKKGFTGRADLFDTDFLSCLSSSASAEKMIERLSGPFGIHELRFKRYPCGAPTHSGIINCKKIIADHKIKTEEIEKIIFEPYPRAIRLVGITHPKTGLEGKFSIPFTAAAQIVFGRVTMETFTDEAVRNPAVLQLLDRMEMIPNDEFTPSRGGRATILLKDGRKFSNSTYLLGHELNLDESEKEVVEKYGEILNPRLGSERTEAIYREIMNLDKAGRLDVLCSLL
ncbi:MmgE/PrpD family protein [Clostridium transplantifaecale]|uniref:MmgE/PrpD family protein n=1 Tax=Clostridium transplantifaecale TaxID=2479838 RepID=UPI0013DDD8B4|nr:MmgE/PrpD family protein [Clostridium transplantifaecale]